MDCIFCAIAHGTMQAKILHDDDFVVAFEDISPKAPHHIIIIPKEHIATLNEATTSHTKLLGHMIQIATKLAKELKFGKDGFRLVMNCNPFGGQTVYHIHLHLLGGRQMQWPPG